MTLVQLAFYLFAALAVVASLMVITRRNPVHSALWLILVFLCLASIFILLRAEFLGAAQLLVYAGGIMVLYIFVIFLVSLEKEQLRARSLHTQWVIALALAIFLFVFILKAFLPIGPLGEKGPFSPEAVASAGGNPKAMGKELFLRYVFPFEVASILLVVAMVGAVVLSRRRIPGAED